MARADPMLRRVLMTADTLGGVWHYALSLAETWSGWGIQTILATMGRPPSATQRTAAAAIEGLVLADSAYRVEWMADADADVIASGAWLLALERCHTPNIIHINGYAHAALPFVAPVIAVAHSDVLSWRRAVHGLQGAAGWQRYARDVRAGLTAADLLIAPTRAVLADLQASYGHCGRRHRVIANGIDLHRVRPSGKRAAVMAVGRAWDEAKNLAALDRVAADLPWPVEIAGDPQHPQGGAASFRNARLLGLLDPLALAARLAQAAIVAAPAYYEPFGLAILEGAAAGAALVLGDIASLREVWGDDALFVPPADDTALLAALRELIGDTAWRDDLAARAHRRAQTYSREHMASAYVDAFCSLLSPRAGTA
jgi:glycosyltransferase involved in cell wall biosynthesis